MFAEIFRFETRYHLKQLLFYVVLVIFFLLTFGAVTSDSVRIGVSLFSIFQAQRFELLLGCAAAQFGLRWVERRQVSCESARI